MSSLIKALRRSSLKHKKLGEEWENNKDVVLDGITFFVKYVGCVLVEEPKGVRSTAEAIKAIVAMAKGRAKKLDRVSVLVSPRGVHVDNQLTHETIVDVPIYRISYCSADAHYDHVFAFISLNKNELFDCHAFLCPKKKIAHDVTLTIAQAFELAFESWQRCELQRHLVIAESCRGNTKTVESDELNEENCQNGNMLLIDLEEQSTPCSPDIESWELFDCEEKFERFIESRFRHPVDGSLSPDNTNSSFRQFLSSRHHLEIGNV